jgi:hypothetical protein
MPAPTIYRGPKFVARVQDYRRKPGATDGLLTFTLEWARVTGVSAGGKFVADVTTSTSEGLSDDLRDALLDHMRALFPTESIRARDVLLIGA